MERLTGKCQDSYERLTKACELAHAANVHIILKGAYSAIITPAGKCYFNPTGNPGMATGGSGDVLTGVILALLAQGYPAEDAAKIGTYIHGLAGDFARKSRDDRTDCQRHHHLSAYGMATCKRIKVKNLQFFNNFINFVSNQLKKEPNMKS